MSAISHAVASTVSHEKQPAERQYVDRAPAMMQAVEPDAADIAAATRPRKPIAWHVVLLCVPEDWQATGWRQGGPAASIPMPAAIACQTAVAINTSRMKRGDGRVNHWVVRIERSDSSRLLTIALAGGWTPATPMDYPPCAVRLESACAAELKLTLSDLNAMAGPGRRWVKIMPLEIDNGPQTSQEAPSVAVEAVQGNGSMDKGPDGKPVHVTFTEKPKGFRIGLRHPEHGVLVLSEMVFGGAEVESILEESAGCCVAVH